MTSLTESRLASRSATALFLGAGAVALTNSLASRSLGAEGVSVRGLQMCAVVSLASGIFVALRRQRLTALERLAIASWGLALLAASAVFGNYAVSSQAVTVLPVFLMVILVWLGLTSARGVAAAFAPVTAVVSVFLALAIPGSRVGLATSFLVIVVSAVVAETISWAMHQLHSREELLAVQASTDPLTGLLNRAALRERLEECCARQEHLKLAFVDLNGFKDVNDTFGHQVGDSVLIEVAGRLRSLAREHDIVARFGGDEFVVLFRMSNAKVEVEALLERIRAVIAEPWPTIAPSVVTASVGMVDDPDGARSPDELLREADTAMYARKRGTLVEPSSATMASRALLHHRAAMDGLGGSFTVLRLVGEETTQDWLIVEANARVREVFTPICGDPVGKLMSELDGVADNSSAQQLYLTALATGTRQETEVELRLPGGVLSWRRLLVVPVDDHVVAVMTWDISAERAATEALRDSEERSLAIVETAADAILTIDDCGLVSTFNQAAEQMFGVSREEAIGRPYAPFAPDESLDALSAALAAGRGGEPLDVMLTRACGTTFHAQVAVSQLETSVGVVYTAIVRDVTQQRDTEQALRAALERDELTGLPNLRSLLERTEAANARARRRGGSVGMLCIDLDRFTLINDSLGHVAGDRLLVLVADRIAATVRETDTVTRVSGDHFLVLCEGRVGEPALTALASRISEALRDPFLLGNEREVFATASIGIALSHGTDTARDLVRFAHTAMHRAKRRGTSGVRVFNDEMSATTTSRLEVDTALRHAIERNELCAYYQPIVDLETVAVEYLEALLRWNRPGLGIIGPDVFIPVAEETSLIVDIGAWILRRAVADCAAWQRDAPGVGVSINVSVHQFRGGNLPALVRAVLEEHELAPGLLMLEITESVMLEHSDRNVAVLEQIRELGVRLALDDFGTGYSALTHLRRMPIDTIKIDRSFLQTVDTEADLPVIRAIVELARAHQVEVVAEGIETESLRRLVRSAGCRHGQGFLFARPAPLDETTLLLAIDSAIPSLD